MPQKQKTLSRSVTGKYHFGDGVVIAARFVRERVFVAALVVGAQGVFV
jgi:hypothetical protein